MNRNKKSTNLRGAAGVLLSLTAANVPEDFVRQSADAQRQTLLSMFKAGSLAKLRLGIRAADNQVNRNFFQIGDSGFDQFAMSFAGRPFLYDHDPSMDSVMGSVVASAAQRAEDGRMEIVQTVELTKPKAIEAALDGTMKEFSIGWDSEALTCSACQADIGGCSHWPGDKLENGDRVAFITEGNQGRETSAVVFAAGRSTGIDEYAIAAAEEARGFSRREARKDETMKISEKLAKALGLTADSTEEQVTAAVDGIVASRDDARGAIGRLALLAELKEDAPAAEVERALFARLAGKQFVPREEHEAALATAKKKENRNAIEAAAKAGKLTAAQAAPGGFAERHAEKHGLPALEELIATMGPQVPIGQTAPAEPAGTTVTLTAEEAKVCELFGTDPTKFAAEKAATLKAAAGAAV